MNATRAKFALWVASAVVALGIIAPLIQTIAHAQNLGQRNVAGLVVEGDSPVHGATVFLRNTKTKAIRSYTSESNGRFRFAQVSMTDDYDLWAEKDGKKSATKTVSSWDARKDFETELKLK